MERLQWETCESAITLIIRNKPKEFKRHNFKVIVSLRSDTLLIKYKKEVLGGIITKKDYPFIECYFDEDVKDFTTPAT
jgi:hypothetical protein